MITDDLLRNSASLRRRIQRAPDVSPLYYSREIKTLADNASNRTRSEEVVLRSKLCVVRSLAFLGRPYAAIAAFDAALGTCLTAHPLVAILEEIEPGRPMDVQATIVSHTRGDDDDPASSESHRFEFELCDAEHSAILNTITLRTALVLTRELLPMTAFGRMIDAIATADDQTYSELVGRVFR